MSVESAALPPSDVTNRQHASRSLLWSLVETFGATGFSLVALVVLARVLSVEQMGLGSLAVLLAYLTSLPFEVLFHDTLVQRPELDELHVSSAFTITGAAALAAAAIVFAFAPQIATAYGQPALADLLRVALIAAPLASVASVVSATLRRRLAFAPLARRTILGRLVGVAAGMATAFAGGGAWSLVVMQVGSVVLSTAVLLADPAHLPRLRCSWRATREMLGFALPNMAAQLLLVGNARIFLGVFAFWVDPASFGRFNLAFRLVEELRNTLSAAVSQLALPLFARQLRDPVAFNAVYFEATRYTVTLLLPLYAGFALLAPDLVGVVFGAKWQGTEAVIQWLCVATLLLIVREFMSVALTARGFPGTNMLVNGLGVLVSLLPFLTGQVAAAAVAAVLWATRAAAMLTASLVGVQRRIGMGLKAQIQPAVPAVCGVAAMGLVLHFVAMPMLQGLAPVARLLVMGAAGAASYLIVIVVVSPALLPGMLRFVAGAVRKRGGA